VLFSKAPLQKPESRPDVRTSNLETKTGRQIKARPICSRRWGSRADWVADVGAGYGYYSMRLSGIVGAEGKVFAKDISTHSIDGINQREKVFDLWNVEIVRGEVDNPKLPPDSLAAVLIVDSYHHFTQYQSMLGQLLHALKPAGPNCRCAPR
jgi:ubiquinone/menaquinone biosynthesis C-methylase UbiE